MARERITADMRGWEVIQRYPETFEAFRRHGCPDMRKGIFALSAHVMKVRWAARAQKIPLAELLRDLNAEVEAQRTGKAA